MRNTLIGRIGVLFSFIVILASAGVLLLPTSSGDVHIRGKIGGVQTWTPAESPYFMDGDVYVTGSLTIQPGVKTLFSDQFSMYVEDTLNANGVYFSPNGTTVLPWGGIFFNSSAASSAIRDSTVNYSGFGVVLNNPSHIEFENSTISGGDAGITVNGTGVSVIRNNYVNVAQYGIRANGANPVIENCTITGGSYDFWLSGNSHVVALNTSFAGSVRIDDSGSDLSVQNYLRVKVIDNDSSPIPNAEVLVMDTGFGGPARVVYATPYFGGSKPATDSRGMTGWITVTDRVYKGGVILPLENRTTVQVYYAGKTFAQNPRDVSMSTSHMEVFRAEAGEEPPRALSWSPTGNNVARDSVITVVFSKPMNNVSVEGAFSYTDGSVTRDKQNGTFSWNSTKERFDFSPAEVFSCCNNYTVTIDGSLAEDQTGLKLGTDLIWSFQTENGPFPQVNGTTPTDGQSNVSITTKLIITFDRPMNESSVEASFSYSNSTTTWNITAGSSLWKSRQYRNDTMVFNPLSNLQLNTTYSVMLNGSVAKDLCDSPLAGGLGYTWNFTTEVVDLTPPQVLVVIPANGTSEVPVSTDIIVRFSESMDRASVESAFNLTNGVVIWTAADGNITWTEGNEVFEFNPDNNLPYNAHVTVRLNGDVAKDLAGNHLDGNGDGVGGDNYTWFFITQSIEDTTPPSVLSHSPNGEGVDVGTSISVTFSEPMDVSSAESAFQYTNGHLTWGAGDGDFSWTGDRTAFHFYPDRDLDYKTEYTVRIRKSARDLSGNAMIADVEWNFKTVPWYGSIIGDVKDESGRHLSNVTVTIKELDLSVKTNKTGWYGFDDVQAGTYTLRYSKAGFYAKEKRIELEENVLTTEIGTVTLQHTWSLADFWWMILLVIVLWIILIFLLARHRKKRAEGEWGPVEEVAYVEVPEEESPPEAPPEEILEENQS